MWISVKLFNFGNHLSMINLALKSTFNPILKQPQRLKLTKLNRLERVNIFAMPSRINNNDITSMFKGLLGLVKEQSRQEQSEKYLQLKLQYARLQYLYNKLRAKLYKR